MLFPLLLLGGMAGMATTGETHVQPDADDAAAAAATTPGWSMVVQSTNGAELRVLGAIPWSVSVAGGADTPVGAGAVLTVEHDPSTVRQRVHGFGAAFTEAAG